MFRAAFHTGYVPCGVLRLGKAQLDGACVDSRFDEVESPSPTHPPTNLFIHLPIYLSIHVPTHPPTHPPTSFLNL